MTGLFLRACALIAAAVLSFSVPPPSGEAPSSSPSLEGESLPENWESSLNRKSGRYLIQNTQDLLLMGELIHKGAVFSDGVRAQDARWLLTADLDLSAACAQTQGGWNPIGSFLWGGVSNEEQLYAFRGVFDGGGHTISGLTISRGAQSEDEAETSMFQGLFGYVCNGEIRDLILKDCRVSGSNAVGAVAGGCWGIREDEGVRIVNCQATGTVRGSGGCGGIVGVASEVLNCGFSGSVENLSPDAQGMGGVAGLVREIRSSRALGEVLGRGLVGGVAGDCLSASDCYAVGSVTGYSEVGGVVGFAGSVTGSFCASIVSGHEAVGGVAGRVGPLSDADVSSALTYCAMTGPAVAVTRRIAGEARSEYGAGRIAGAVDAQTAVGPLFVRSDMTIEGGPFSQSVQPEESRVALNILHRAAAWETILSDGTRPWESVWKTCEDGMYPQLKWETGPALSIS